MKLYSVELRNYRIIGSTPVVIPCGRHLTLIVGQNNSGKSTVFKAMRTAFTALRSSEHQGRLKEPCGLQQIDCHARVEENSFLVKLNFELEESHDFATWLGETAFYLTVEIHDRHIVIIDHSAASVAHTNAANHFFRHFKNHEWTSEVDQAEIRRQLLPIGLDLFNVFRSHIPTVEIVPEFRQIRDQPGAGYDTAGLNLIERLAQLKSPQIGMDHNKGKFIRIEQATRDLLDMPDGSLEISHGDNKLIVGRERIRLPLGSYGTGVHELLILLTAVASAEENIICIEEPEIHLHPRLQKAFMKFLSESVEHSFMISTHSPSLINSTLELEDAVVIHAHGRHGRLSAELVDCGQAARDALDDLGCKPSDLLQTNCIIWVEGPSDRHYLSAWLAIQRPDLIEGIHFSVMFYGGRLLSHLSANDDELEARIQLLRLNRRSIIVMDSDKTSETAHMPAAHTKLRIADEVVKSDGVAWITSGRCIENYLTTLLISQYVNRVRKVNHIAGIGPYDDFGSALDESLIASGIPQINYSAHKAAQSRIIASLTDSDNLFGEGAVGDDLQARLDEVGARIAAWNS